MCSRTELNSHITYAYVGSFNYNLPPPPSQNTRLVLWKIDVISLAFIPNNRESFTTEWLNYSSLEPLFFFSIRAQPVPIKFQFDWRINYFSHLKTLCPTTDPFHVVQLFCCWSLLTDPSIPPAAIEVPTKHSHVLNRFVISLLRRWMGLSVTERQESENYFLIKTHVGLDGQLIPLGWFGWTNVAGGSK